MAITPQQVTTVIDNSAKVIAAIKRLADSAVLVGIPVDKAPRDTKGINNATLAYIHTNGDPAHNIPARPFLEPGIKVVRGQIVGQLKQAGSYALKGDEDSMVAQLNAVGMVASQSAKNMITQGLSPPLKAATIAARLRRTGRGQTMMRAIKKSGTSIAAWGAVNMKPLYDSGQILRAITYVVRRKGKDDIEGKP